MLRHARLEVIEHFLILVLSLFSVLQNARGWEGSGEQRRENKNENLGFHFVGDTHNFR